MTLAFSDEQRRIYKCPVTAHCHDPLALRRAFILSKDYNSAAEGVRAHAEGTESHAQAEEKLVAIGRSIFAMPAINPDTGEGWTDTEVIGAVSAFTRWLKGKVETAQS